MRTDDLKLGNGRVRVTTLHESKRGKAYKRRHVVKSAVQGPTWFRRAMMKLRWFK